MRRIKFLLKKEFKQIFRNKAMLPIIFVLPIVQLLILVNAATFEIKKIDIAILDLDNSQTSKSVINILCSSIFFIFSFRVLVIYCFICYLPTK